MIDFLIQPWPWYVSGALIGFTVPLLLLIGNKSFGISSSFRNGIAACGMGNSMEYFQFDWKAQKWNFLFILGVILAGIIAIPVLQVEQNELSEAFLSYLGERGIAVESIFPSTYFSENMGSVSTLLLIVGGIFIGFGSRYAGVVLLVTRSRVYLN